MNAPIAEPRSTPRQRVAGIPQVDVAHSAAADQLAITVHVDVAPGFAVPAGFKGAVATAIASLLPAAAAQPGQDAAEQAFEASDTSGAASEGAEAASDAQEVEV